MKKISSRSTVFYKKLFPTAWFGFLVMFVVVGLTKREFGVVDWWPFVGVPIFMAVLGFVIMRKLVWDLADEVHDGGDFLLVRKGGDEERVPLANIMNVNSSINANPQRVTLRLVKPGKFGPEISFALPARFSFRLFATHPIADDLIVRVDRARRRD